MKLQQLLLNEFMRQQERCGLTRKVLAARIGKSPAQITRWLTGAGNLTQNTVSDLLLGMGGELEPVFAEITNRLQPCPNIGAYASSAVTDPSGLATAMRGASAGTAGAAMQPVLAALNAKPSWGTTGASTRPFTWPLEARTFPLAENLSVSRALGTECPNASTGDILTITQELLRGHETPQGRGLFESSPEQETVPAHP
jgi:hypothetical protein